MHRKEYRVLVLSQRVNPPVQYVWRAWTTPEGMRSFFAPDCRIEIKPGGPYEILFDRSQNEGSKGSEGAVILTYYEPEYISFTWNNPPVFPEIRSHFTHVEIFPYAEGAETEVILR